jgi:hypothetical protein
LLVGIYGIIRIMAGEAYDRPEVKRPVQNFFSRVEGVVMSLFGLLLSVAGAILTLFPGPFASFFN